MLTASQLRAARALSGLTIEELAAASGLSMHAIQHAEAAEAHPEAEIAERLRTIFGAKGVIFLAAGEGDATAGPGVRMRQVSHDEGIRPQNLNASNDG